MPFIAYLVLALLLSLVGSLGLNQWQKSQLSSLKKSSKERIEQLESANATWVSSLKAVQDSQKSCEAGRKADQDQMAKTLKEREDAKTKLAAELSRARSDLAKEISGRCSRWATQSSCGLPDVGKLLKGGKQP